MCMYLCMCIMLLQVNKLQLEVHLLCGIHVYRLCAIYLLWSLQHLFMILVIIIIVTFFPLTCKILQNSFFFPLSHNFHIFFYFGSGKFSPNLFSVILPSVMGTIKILYIQGSSDSQEFPNYNKVYIT